MLQYGMNLRNAIFILSTVMIIFCLTLYFQSETAVESINYEQYKELQYNEGRSHPLSELNAKIAPYNLEDILSDIYEKNKFAGEKTRVMEIGFGNGRVLMELKKRFPEVEFYGINKEKTLTFYRRESFILTALKFNIMTKVEAENMTLPYAVFQDLDFGKHIPYDDNKFDLIFSQGTIPHIRYTFELFNDIMRVLKKNGLSLHTDVTGVNIFFNGVHISMKEATKELRKRGIEIYVLENPQSIRFRKPEFNTSFPFTPHLPIPQQTNELTTALRRPEMSYNLNP
jgi:ubiquinone/menaquinone biosynthesis C-methylase UbiE